MKKIIDGSKYDTKTAKYLGNYCHGSSRDFSHIDESLYRTKSGKYFLHGEGGPQTHYAEHIDQNTWSGGEKIIPMDRAEAQKWAEDHLSGEEYEEIFGEVTEDEKEPLNILLPAGLKSELWKLAENQKVSISELVIGLLQKAIS